MTWWTRIKRPLAEPAPERWPAWVAYEPGLVPSPGRMRGEGIEVLEEWFRWGEEWSMLLRVYGRLGRRSRVLEIGCGQGRTAFPLRYLLGPEGSYDGFDITADKIEFLRERFTAAHPNFRFAHADVHNTFYNPRGRIAPTAYRFPYDDGAFDLVYAASVFTHMLPENAARYFAESARVLAPGGRCVFSLFLLDHYRRGRPRPHGFARRDFDFDHPWGAEDGDFAVARPDNPEQMTAFRLALVERLAARAGLRLAEPPVPGIWSGAVDSSVGAQDLVVLSR